MKMLARTLPSAHAFARTSATQATRARVLACTTPRPRVLRSPLPQLRSPAGRPRARFFVALPAARTPARLAASAGNNDADTAAQTTPQLTALSIMQRSLGLMLRGALPVAAIAATHAALMCALGHALQPSTWVAGALLTVLQQALALTAAGALTLALHEADAAPVRLQAVPALLRRIVAGDSGIRPLQLVAAYVRGGLAVLRSCVGPGILFLGVPRLLDVALLQQVLVLERASLEKQQRDGISVAIDRSTALMRGGKRAYTAAMLLTAAVVRSPAHSTHNEPISVMH
jgi:hypothetical protein